MTEINVIKVETQQRVLTREEREIIYQDLANKLNIPYFYFEQIINLEDENIAYETAHIKPAFTVLLFRRLLEFNNVLPIVRELKKGVSDPILFANLYGVHAAVGGDDVKHITLQTLKAQKVVTQQNLNNYLAASAKDRYKFINITSEMEVCGFIITDDASVTYNAGISSVSARIKSGSYHDQYLWDTIFDPFFNLEKKIYKHADFLTANGNFYYFLFKDDEEIIKKQVGMLFDFLIHRNSYKDYCRQYLHLCANLENDRKFNILTNRIIKNLDIFKLTDSNVELLEKPAKKSAIQQYFEDLEKENFIVGKLGFHYSNTIWFDLISRHMSIVLEKLIFIHSKETSAEQKKQYEKDIDIFVKQRKQEMLTNSYINEQNRELFEKLFQEMEYRYIYIEKFGFEKYQQIHAKFPVFGTVKAKVQAVAGYLFDHIPTAEKDMVLSTYKKREAEIKLNVTKSASWLPILKKFNNTDPRQKANVLEELRKFMEKKPEDGWYYSKEGVPILCSHVVEKTEMEAKHMLLNDIRNVLLTYAGEFSLTDGIYCKICGEMITYVEEEGVVLFEGDQPISFHNLEDDLKDFIWRITNQTLRSNLHFKSAVSNKYVNMMTTSITMKIYDLVFMIETKLAKAKTSTIEEIENKKTLFTVIYVYAILCKIVLDNYPEISFTNVKPVAEKLLEYSLEKIIMTQNVVLNSLPDINDDFLKTSLDKAFQNIVMLIDKAKLEPPPEIELSYSIYLDPIFLYSAHMKMLENLQDVQKVTYNTMEKIWQNSYKTESLFKNFDASKEKPYLYDDLKTPTFSGKLSDNFINLAKGTGHYIDRDDFVDNIYAGYLIESYKLFIKYVQSHLFTLDLYKVNLTINEKEEITSIESSLNDQMKQFFKQTADVRIAEKIYKTICKHYRMLAFSTLPYKKHSQFKYDENLDIKKLSLKYGYHINKNIDAKIFGIDKLENKFHKHKWEFYAFVNIKDYQGKNLTTYDKKNVKIYYYKAADIANIEDFDQLIPIDRICKFCLYYENTAENDIPDIKDVMNEQQTLINFYNYYENRCPNPGKDSIFHIYKNAECVKCGFVKGMYYKRDEKYFHKFNENFEREIKARSKIKQITETDIYNDEFSISKKQNIEKIGTPSEYIKKWKYNNNIINEFVIKTFEQLQKVMPKLKKMEYVNIINNIGLTEKYIYDDIVSGKENPYKEINDILAKMRINKIRNYIHEIFYLYSIIKNNKNILVLPADIKLLLEGFDTKELLIIDKITDINKLYKEDKYDYFELDKITLQEYAGDYLKQSEFHLDFLFNILLHIQEYLEKQNKKIANNVIVFLISKIMISERVTAKLKESKKTAIEAGQNIENVITGEDHEDDLGEDLSLKHKPSDFDFDFDYEPNEDHDDHV